MVVELFSALTMLQGSILFRKTAQLLDDIAAKDSSAELWNLHATLQHRDTKLVGGRRNGGMFVPEPPFLGVREPTEAVPRRPNLWLGARC